MPTASIIRAIIAQHGATSQKTAIFVLRKMSGPMTGEVSEQLVYHVTRKFVIFTGRALSGCDSGL
jgi:hypothetical protein